MTTNTKTFVACLIVRSVLNDIAGYQVLKQYRVLRDRNAKCVADLTYVVDLMNKKGIELEEFDLIALNFVSKKSS
jgi:hypothetical protein